MLNVPSVAIRKDYKLARLEVQTLKQLMQQLHSLHMLQ